MMVPTGDGNLTLYIVFNLFFPGETGFGTSLQLATIAYPARRAAGISLSFGAQP